MIRIWYRKNGLDAPRSSTEVTIRASAEPEVAAWNFVDTFAAGDTFQLVCFSTGTRSVIAADSGTVLPVSPNVPSVILTATLIGSQ